MASFEQRGNAVRAIVSVPGIGRKSATFDTMKEARAWAETMERKKSLGEIKRGAKGITVGELFEAYHDAVGSKADGAAWNQIRINMFLLDPISRLDVAQVITHDINEWIDRRLNTISDQTGQPISGSTVNRELNLMSAAFTYAAKTRKWITENPCHGAARPEKGPPRNRPLLTAEEIKAVCAATGYREDIPLTSVTSRVGACFLLALETGMRSGEILRLRPIDYSKEDRTVRVSALEKGGRKGSKSGRIAAGRVVPLTMRAIELLDQLMETMPKGQPYIVGLSDKQRDANWRKCRDMSGVADLTFHDTKHEACTRLCKFLDVIALSHAIGTKNLKLLRDTYYNNDAKQSAMLLPDRLAVNA